MGVSNHSTTASASGDSAAPGWPPPDTDRALALSRHKLM
jgi:hypothetical protein